jgi:hypothetical protein
LTPALVVFVVAACAGVVLSVTVASGRPILAARWSLLWQLGGWALAWVVAVVAALRLPRRVAVVAIVAAGVALRIAALAGPPTTSDDLYRYSWDGRVQAAGIDPYANAPSSPALVGLRDAWLWPDAAGCAALHRPVGCTRINRPDQRTIYPPVAEAWFAGVFRIAGVGARHKAWQVAGLFTELGVLALLPVTLRRWGRDPRWTALYALSPAPVLEVVNNGHVDGLAVLCIVAALAVAGGSMSRWRDVAVGALIGAAAMVKLYPAVLVIAFGAAGGAFGVASDRARGVRRFGSVVRVAGTAAAFSALAYVPHVVRVGSRVLGYLPGYLREEHYRTGGRFLLAGLLHLPHSVAGPASAIAVAAAMVWVVLERPSPPVGACVVIGAVLLAASPIQPWYAVMLLALATVAAMPWWAAVVAAGYPYFFAVILDDRHATGHGQAAYAVAFSVVVVGALMTSHLAGRRARPPAVSAAPPPTDVAAELVPTQGRVRLR